MHVYVCVILVRAVNTMRSVIVENLRLLRIQLQQAACEIYVGFFFMLLSTVSLVKG